MHIIFQLQLQHKKSFLHFSTVCTLQATFRWKKVFLNDAHERFESIIAKTSSFKSRGIF